jgi:hypothetical protein
MQLMVHRGAGKFLLFLKLPGKDLIPLGVVCLGDNLNFVTVVKN